MAVVWLVLGVFLCGYGAFSTDGFTALGLGAFGIRLLTESYTELGRILVSTFRGWLLLLGGCSCGAGLFLLRSLHHPLGTGWVRTR
jgi:hypothetical protein